MSRDAARARLRAVADTLPRCLAEVFAAPATDLGVDAARVRRWWVTGVGSSAANARFLASVMSEDLGLPARYVPTGALLESDGGEDVCLIVFSQGLSPNGCLALERVERWGRVVVVTAIHLGTPDRERAGRRAALEAAGARFVALPAALAEEHGTLVRLVGPAVATLAALQLARSLAVSLGRVPQALQASAETVDRAVRAAARRAESVLPVLDADRALVLIASGGYAERVQNLGIKLQEGLVQAAPWLGDVTEFAHGVFQQHYAEAADIVFLAREDARDEQARIEQVRAMLPVHHRLHVLPATLPGAFAALDHEAQWNALVLRAMEARDIDPECWPGRGADGPLYDVGPQSGSQGARGASAAPVRDLAHATSPEVADALAAGATTAVVALGSTEQHGAHLPLGTDTWVGDALAARFCAQVPEAQRCPTLALGCASEHLGFAGTLSLAPETLEAILRDLLKSLMQNGFERVFVFSAHGGNVAALEEMAARLAATVPALELIAFADHGAVTAACHSAAEAVGVSAAAAGHHAGEFETSIIAGLVAGSVRDDPQPGLLDVPRDVQRIFYPDLRTHAPNGVVGDPRGADPRRAAAYLDAWVDVLLAAYREAK